MDISLHGVTGVRLSDTREHDKSSGGKFYCRDIIVTMMIGGHAVTTEVTLFSDYADGLCTPEEIEANRTMDARAAEDSLLDGMSRDGPGPDLAKLSGIN